MKNVFKKGLSLLLAITIIFSSAIVGIGEIDFSGSLGIEVKAVSKTVDEAMAWCEGLKNVKVGTGQCVALIKAYYEFLGVSPVYGNGCDYATNSLPAGWSRVAGGEPQAGDILVYTGAKYGHVAIYAGGSTSYHQNLKGLYVERRDNWPYYNSWYSNNEGGTKSYWGYIRPDFKTTPSETTPPVISDVVCRNTDTGYLVTCNVSDNVGVAKVLFPSWTVNNGQDDIVWHEGTLTADGKSAYCWIDASAHNHEKGYYVTHIYAYDASDNFSSVGTSYIYVGDLIQWWWVSNPDNSDAGIDSSTTFTISGKYKFWFKEYDEDTNYYVNVSLDGNQLLYNASSDDNGYVSVIIDSANIPAGLHTLTADLYDSQAKYTVSKQFYVVHPEAYVYFDMNDGSSNNINLLAPKKASATSGGITYSYDGATGIITLNGTATGNVDLFSKPFKAVNGEIYKVSATYVSGSLSNGCVVLEARDNDGNRMNFDILNSSTKGTWTITSTQASKINRVDFWAWCNTSAGKLTFNNYKIKLKLEKVASSSASATAYTPNAKYLEYGQTYATMPAPTRTGYTLDGWYTSKTGGTKITASTVFTGSSAQTLYAHWTPNKYTVTFNANGGSGVPSAQTKTYGTNLTLSSTIPTRTGYTFKGWNTKADGTGTSYSAGGTYKANEAVTLYAQWVANTYSVKFDANGGSGAPSVQTKTYGTTLTLSSTIPSQTGYTFTGWNTKADGSGTTYSAGASYTANESVTLYAQWKVITFAVTYNVNGGSGAPSTQTKIYGTVLTVSSTIPIRTGYTFTGWNTKIDGTGLNYSVGSTYTENSELTLYAQWMVNTYTVTFNANSGNCSIKSMQVTFDETYGKLPTPTRAGYIFSGWYTEISGGSKITDETVYTIAGDQVLYAHWSTKSYRVYYYANGGTGAPAPQMKYDAYIILSETIPEREGYTFVCWNTMANGKGMNYAPGDVYGINADVRLYAQWEKTVTSINVYKQPLKTEYEYGETLNTTGLELEVTYYDGSTEIITSGFTTNGLMSTVPGMKKITVTYKNKTTSFYVTVRTPYITLSSNNESIYVGDVIRLTATTSPKGQVVTWTSSNRAIATVNNNGVITAMAPGTATITAKFTSPYMGVICSATCLVTVTEFVHTHTEGDWIIDIEATCTEDGSKHKECTTCGEILETAVILSNGHNFVDGFCSVCDVEIMFEYTVENNSVIITGYKSEDTTIEVPYVIDGLPVTAIGTDAFRDCTEITSVAIADSVTSIGGSAFRGCTNLEKLVLSDNITSISGAMCYGCTKLETVIIPDGVVNIGGYAFSSCTSLKTAVIPDNVTNIGGSVFVNCKSLIAICEENSSAHTYAVDNSISYIIETTETDIDSASGLIYTDVQGGDLDSIVSGSKNVVCSMDKIYAGTGAIIDVMKDGVLHSQYTLIVNGDTNGDSICDVLDCAQVEIASNGNGDLTGAYTLAADSNTDEVVDITDYQAVVNKALAS